MVEGHTLGTRKGELEATWNGLHHDIGVFNTAFPELRDCAIYQSINDGLVPSGVYDCNAESRAIILVCRRTFDRAHY
jgi:hypothetical protein